jgi:hypothetical protein
LYTKWRAADDDPRKGPKPRPFEIDKANTIYEDASAAVNLAKKKLEETSAGWRQEYAEALNAAVMPVREALWDLAQEVDSAMKCMTLLADKAAIECVGSSWIARQARPLNHTLLRLYAVLEIDKSVETGLPQRRSPS